MDKSQSSGNLQQNLWKAIEMVLNSQLYTPNTRSRFRELTTSCAPELGLVDDNASRYLTNSLQVVSALYRKYVKRLQVRGTDTDTKIINFSHKLNFDEYDSSVASFLRKFEDYIRENLTPFVSGIFLHGSLATNDYTGFSDVDAGIFIKDDVMVNPILLKKLQQKIKGVLKIVLKFDNLQHHGLFIIPEGFLLNYPEEYLPLEVFKYSKAVDRSFQVKVNAKKNLVLAREKFLQISRSFTNKDINLPKNLYEMKHKLSTFMLLPSVYLQAKGQYVYKKFSFELVKKYFPEEWRVIDEISQIRQNWIRSKSILFNSFVETSFNSWIVSTVSRKLDWRIPRWLSMRFTPEFHEGMTILSLKMKNTLVR